MQWLRTQNIKTVKDFKKECEWRWLVNNHIDRLCVKENDNMRKACKKTNRNNIQDKHEYEKEAEEIEDNSQGVIRVFINNTLRIIDRNCNFQHMHQEDASRFVFNDEIEQEIVRKEVIAVTDASDKHVSMTGVSDF